MNDSLYEVITDVNCLRSRCVERCGYVFTSITHPANVYDAIVIKHPSDVLCSSPQLKGSAYSLEEQVAFINKYKIEKAFIITDDIGFITECPSLKYLKIVPADNSGDGFDYSPLYKMQQIKKLSCSTVYGRLEEYSTFVDYLKISGLEDVSIGEKGHNNYENIKSLKSLKVSGYGKPDLTWMFSSPVLDTLMIIQSKIKSLEGLQMSERMQCLYLYYNRCLQDISSLYKVKKTLKALRIENCPKIDDFSVLSELDHLELLELSGQNSLDSLSFISSMKNLKTFTFNMNVKNGDLSPCLDLSYVYSEKNRKHYNLKDADLPKGKYVRGNETIEEWRRLE